MPQIPRSLMPRRFRDAAAPGDPRYQRPQGPRCVPFGAHTPVMLSAQASIDPSGQSAMRNVAFKNPFPTAIEITEIRFQIYQDQALGPAGPDSIGTSVGGQNAIGGTFGAKIILGSFPLTSGTVPISNLGRSVSLKNELFLTSIGTLGPSGVAVSEYDWRLDDSFILPPNVGPQITIANFGKIQSAASVTVSLCGRKLDTNPPPNQKVRIPWVSNWQSNPYAGTATSLQSTETDLTTPPDRGIRLNWFSQRALSYTPGEALTDSYPTVGVDTAWYRDVTIRIQDSRGYLITKTQTNYGASVDPLTRVWDFGQRGIPLPAGTYWLVFAETVATPSDANGSLIGQLQMAMGGSYAVDYSEILP